MIKIKLRSIGEGKSLTAPVKNGELLSDAVHRALGETPFKDRARTDFQVVLNGHLIEEKFWDITSTRDGDNILIAPKLGGDNNSMRSLAVIAVAVAANYFTYGAWGFVAGSLSGAAVAAGVTIAGSLIASALFPPPTIGGLGKDAQLSDSQMYSITSQSNQVLKLGQVPKVYGTHRMFPPVAANPYTEFEANADGKLVNYLYCVYDFGFGPATVGDIRIGDTPIGEFQDVDFRLVDFNKPDVDEGVWDEALNKTLKYYHGDVSTVAVGVTLDKNSSDIPTPPEATWRAVRTAATNPTDSLSELSIVLEAPQGLLGVASNGSESERKVFFDIEFALDGTEDWKGFNDLEEVIDYRATGGDVGYSDSSLSFPLDQFSYIRNISKFVRQSGNGSTGDGGVYTTVFNRDAYGLPKGSTSVLVNKDPLLEVGTAIRSSGELIARVGSIESVSATVDRLVFDTPTTRAFEIVDATYNTNMFGRGIITFSNNKGLYRGIPNIKKAVLRGNSNDPVFATYKWWPKNPGQYKIRVTRTSSSSAYTKQVFDTVIWRELKTRYNLMPINTDKRHVFLEVRIRATNQLNGAIGNLSGVVNSVLDTWDGTKWVKQESSNPAWVYVDLLTTEVNRRKIDKSRLHIDSIYEWAQFCDEVPQNSDPDLMWGAPRFQCNFVLDFNTTLQSIVEKVTSASQASLNIIDGQYGVLIDRKKTIPVQVFSPRNTISFNSTRNYSRPVHALDVQWVNPSINWETDSIRVYMDGYDETTATEIEELPSFGVTNGEQAWRFGRYNMFQALLRQENISITVDMEYIVCTRGDYVQFTQDVMRVGGRPARVKAVVGNEVFLDDAFENSFGPNWGYVFRSIGGGIHKGSCSPTGARSFVFDGELPEIGDLAIIGTLDQEVIDCIVKSITPADDLTATLVLVEKADAIHDAENGIDFPGYDSQLSSTVDTDNRPPGPVENLIVTDNAFNCVNGGYENYISLDWDAPTGSTYEYFEVYVDWGDGMNFVDRTKESIFTYIVDPVNLDKEHTFKVLAVSSNGLKLEIGSVTGVSTTPEYKDSPPSNVERLTIDITNQVLQLSWDKILDCDVSFYRIRYTPIVDGGAWSASTPLVEVPKDQTFVSVQGRVGTYFIKAVDFNGNESANTAQALTTIPNLFDLNIIETISDTPGFIGSKDKVVKVGSSLVLDKLVSGDLATQEYYPQGYYYYKELIDLGDIYTVRLQSNVQAAGFTEEDLMANWKPLAALTAMATATTADWDVKTQYRTSTARNVMEDWPFLEFLGPLAEGEQGNFSEWRDFTMGDATGRVFQFRLLLVSKRASVTPRVFDGTVKADMPDRIESFDNLVAPDAGLYIPFTPEFKGPSPSPAISISIDGMQSGDRWELTDRDLTGFRIQFFDASNTAVSRQFDAVIKGYGSKNNEII